MTTAPSGRTLLGRLPHLTALAGTLERLRGPRAPVCRVLVALNPTAAHALMDASVAEGMRPGTWLLVARVDGDSETVALGTRGFWQAVELAGGQAEILDRLGLGEAGVSGSGAVDRSAVVETSGSVASETDGPVIISGVRFDRLIEPWASDVVDARAVVLSVSSDELPAVMAAVGETAALVGDVAVRGLPLAGEVWGALPEHPRCDEALAWLRAEAERLGATMRLM